MNFKTFLLLEASYKGNLGMMEMIKFYQVATPAEKQQMAELISHGQQEAAWQLLQQVTHVQLQQS